jgi:hypothetical protein
VSLPRAIRPEAQSALRAGQSASPHAARIASGLPAPAAAAALVLAALLALASGMGDPAEAARVYDPFLVPKARYVPPLAPWPQDSYRAKDFAVHRKGGFYHLFYTRVHRHLPEHWSDGTRHVLNESTFGHALSFDLENWFEADTVLTVSGDPLRWDAHHLWAPTIYEHQDTTWMLFTGVRDRQEGTTPTSWVPRWQVIGAAYSTDPLLREWVQLPDPVWGPCPEEGLPGVPWALCNATLPRGAADFRDPYVLPPTPGSGDPWLLFYTARPRTDQFNYVVGIARANRPNGPWTDLGALWDTYYPPLNSKVESPHAFVRGADWHLLFTGDDGTTGIAWHTSYASPLGPWLTQPSLNVFLKDAPDHPYEFELEPEAWFASEYFKEPTPSGVAEYLAVVHSYDAPAIYNAPPPATPADISIVEFRRMEWDAAGQAFALSAPNPVRSLAVSDASVEVGQAVELTLRCEGGTGRTAELAARVVSAGETIDLDPALLGLPRSVALGDPEVTLPWTVSAGNLTPPVELTLRVADQPLEAGVQVAIQGGGTVAVEPRARLEFRVRGPIAAGGAPPVLELTLPRAARARVDLYDLRGRHMRTLVDGTLPAGPSALRWDGADDAGRVLASGLYLAHLTTPFGARRARLLVVR